MRVLDTLAGSSASAPATLQWLLGFIARPETGGLQGLVGKFESAGLTAQIRSWLDGGHPVPITADQVWSIFSSADIAQLASRTGLNTNQALAHLVEALPVAVKELNPLHSIAR